MKQAVLLLAHGAPESLKDIPEYLGFIRGGRPTPPRVIDEVRRRYELIGGGSPMTARTREQARALEHRLGVPVYFGMRNWHPLIRETVERMKADAVERVVAICLVPQYSESSAGVYFRRTQEAKQAAAFGAEIVWTRTFHDHPLLIEAFYERLRPLLPAQRVLFTAHSLPEEALEGSDAYVNETVATARLVAERSGLAQWDLAYQSKGFTDEKWLGPAVESVLDRYASEGVSDVVLQPIGFVSDHLEILYDVDIAFRAYAEARSMTLRRPESLNDSGAFIAALAAVAEERLCRA